MLKKLKKEQSVKCSNCGQHLTIGMVHNDKLGLHYVCPMCQSSFDVELEAGNTATESVKFIFLTLDIQNGEYEHHSNSVHILSKDQDTEQFTSEYASQFYGGGSEPNDEYFEFFGGSIAVSVGDYKEVTEEEYNVLSKFI